MMRFAVFCAGFAFACGACGGGGGGGATVVEIPPQDLPSPPAPTVVVVANAAPAAPMRGGEEWVGKYRCAQGMTDLVIHIDAVRGDAIDAIFEFAHDPSGATGSYRMEGRVGENGSVVFVAGEWIERPPNYVTVGMHGVVRNASYSGRIDNPSCGSFTVTRR